MKVAVVRSLSFEILKALGAGLALSFILSSPSGTRRLLRGVKEEWKNRNVPRTLSRLSRKKLIIFKLQRDGSLLVELTDRGEKMVWKFQSEEIVLSEKTMDGYWRIIFFDIPEKQKRAREALRNKFVAWGLYPLQKSVYVSLYPCEEEITILQELFDLSESRVVVVKTHHIPNGERIRKHFGLESER